MYSVKEHSKILLEQISLYSTQIEEYDRTNAVIGIRCIGFTGALLSAALTLSGFIKDGADAEMLYRALSIVMIIIPCLIKLFLYIFSMNCRRVALYRGYLKYLEERIQEINEFESIDLLYNKRIDPLVYAKYPSNRIGGISLIVFLFFIFCVSGIMGWVFASQCNNTFSFYYHIVFVILVALVLAAGIVDIEGLMTNENAANQTYLKCKGVMKWENENKSDKKTCGDATRADCKRNQNNNC